MLQSRVSVQPPRGAAIRLASPGPASRLHIYADVIGFAGPIKIIIDSLYAWYRVSMVQSHGIHDPRKQDK